MDFWDLFFADRFLFLASTVPSRSKSSSPTHRSLKSPLPNTENSSISKHFLFRSDWWSAEERERCYQRPQASLSGSASQSFFISFSSTMDTMTLESVAHDAFKALVNLSDSPMLVSTLSETSFLAFIVSYIIVSPVPCSGDRYSSSLVQESPSHSRRSCLDALVKSHSISSSLCKIAVTDGQCHSRFQISQRVLPNSIPLCNLCFSRAISFGRISRSTGAASPVGRICRGIPGGQLWRPVEEDTEGSPSLHG